MKWPSSPWLYNFYLCVERFDLLHKIIAFVKDEGNNLTTMATTIHSIIYCEPLKILRL